MPVMDGVEATAAIRKRCPDVAVLVLTTYDTDEAIVRAVGAGAAGYSEATVRTHLVHIYDKLGVSDRAAAVAQAYETVVLSV